MGQGRKGQGQRDGAGWRAKIGEEQVGGAKIGEGQVGS